MFPKAIFLFLFVVFVSLVTATDCQISPPGRGIGVSSKRPPPTETVTVDVPMVAAARQSDPSALIDPKEKKLIKPDADIIAEFQTMLRKPGYGIVKLLNSKCRETSAKVLNVADGCLRTIPGNGSDFSFRLREHTTAETSDLKLKNGKFIVGSIFTQGLITLLGEKEFEEIDLNAEGVAPLAAFEPAVKSEGASKQTTEINRGMVNGRFLISSTVDVRLNQTYVLRPIAYRVHMPFEDKRRDTITAFQIVRQDEDGSVTLIFKELQSKESPKLKIDK
jgi:hypothetical protein